MSCKTIWAAWLQGRHQAPKHVQRILRLWEELNPERNLHVVDSAEADLILKRVGVNQPRITPQVKANIVRSVLLKEQGGAWVDATLLPTAPLASWLDELMEPSGFFAFRSPGDPNLVLQNWFLASEAGNPLMSKWCDYYVDYFSTIRYWDSWKRALCYGKVIDYIKYTHNVHKRNTLWFVDPKLGRDCVFYPYAAHNYNLAYLIKTDPEVSDVWNNVPTKWAALPLMAGSLAADSETPDEALASMHADLLNLSPVHKLNHRDKRFDVMVSKVREQLGLPSDK